MTVGWMCCFIAIYVFFSYAEHIPKFSFKEVLTTKGNDWMGEAFLQTLRQKFALQLSLVYVSPDLSRGVLDSQLCFTQELKVSLHTMIVLQMKIVF